MYSRLRLATPSEVLATQLRQGTDQDHRVETRPRDAANRRAGSRGSAGRKTAPEPWVFANRTVGRSISLICASAWDDRPFGERAIARSNSAVCPGPPPRPPARTSDSPHY